MTRLRVSRTAVTNWILTGVQVIGLIGLAYGVLIDRFRNPAIIPAATGLLMFPKVYGSGERE